MDAQNFYESDYAARGLDAQRRWPNEEFVRFMGRNFFGKGPARILEMGCGTGPNLRLVAEEGFEAWGVDFSPAAIEHCRAMLAGKGLSANLHVGRMENSGLPSAHFDAVVDVFSAYCLRESAYSDFLTEVPRLLKPRGRFFAYTPSRSTAHLKDIVFAGNDYPWHFTTYDELAGELARRGFTDIKGGTQRRPEGFEFVMIEARHGTPTDVK
jgi:SAM-dependent methyltransferase